MRKKLGKGDGARLVGFRAIREMGEKIGKMTRAAHVFFLRKEHFKQRPISILPKIC